MAKKIITLDPGHGKSGNKSPNNPKYIEGTQMWHLANKLKAALERYGFEVVTTRPNITDDPELEARGAMASGSCLFLSLHSNTPAKNADGSYDTSITGTELYYSLTRAENKALSDQLGNKVSELMGNKFRGSKTKEYPGKPGVDYYAVIRSSAQHGCKCAMIIEHGFHTNVKDSNFLLDDSNLQKLADAEAQIIAAYFGMQEQSGEPDVLYRVQVGAYAKRENAEATAAKLKAAGFDAYIVSSDTSAEPEAATHALKSIDEIAREVLNGLWGNGSERKQRLIDAGYDYAAVQQRVNELAK